jgi:hypothetical protein
VFNSYKFLLGLEISLAILILIFKYSHTVAKPANGWYLFPTLNRDLQIPALEKCFVYYGVKNIAKGGNKSLKYFLTEDRDIVKNGLEVPSNQKLYP